MDYQYFIATNRTAYEDHIHKHNLELLLCRYIYDRFQIAGLRDITIYVIGYGRKELERDILNHYSHHNVKLEYI